MIARVAIEIGPDRLFDYSVPPEWRGKAALGSRVTIPFGQRRTSGYIVQITAAADATPTPATDATPTLFDLEQDKANTRKLRDIISVDGDRPYILPSLIELAGWIANYYIAPLERCLQTLLPAPVRSGRGRALQRLFVEAIEGTKGQKSEVGILTQRHGNAEASRRDKKEESARLTSRQLELLENIRRVGGGWLGAICDEFSCAPATIRKLEEKGAVTIAPRAIRRDPLANRRILPTQPLDLNNEQSIALEQVLKAIGLNPVMRAEGAWDPSQPREPSNPNVLATTPTKYPPKPILLHGVTGSGKTEVYLQAIAAVLERDGGAIVLVPEIALTPQTVQRFASRFGQKIAVLHSALSDGERYDEWQRIRDGAARVVVGPRSAIFAPIQNLGLIVVDEEHEPSYKQDETPRYHARDIAVVRANIEGCAALLGSATPSLETWRNVQKGKYTLAQLRQRADNAAMPAVQIVDMRIEQAKSGHVRVFSQALLDAIQARLERGEQTILFLNRRGYSTSLICPACGYVATCHACDIAFTYHRVDDCLRCHMCGAWERPADACPGCADPKFRYSGFGTQRIEQIMARCFPKARIGRMDADSTSRKFSHDDILGDFRAGRTDILIGTQMIAKGLHFPNVTLVGIVLADSSLHLPDFRAGERTFQLLAQVSGRTGRGATPGEVLIQTYTPEHPAIVAARTEDFNSFAEGELKDRQQYRYPPFTRLSCLTLRGDNEERVAFTAAALAQSLQAQGIAGVEISEPCPAPIAKIKHNYRYQLMLRSGQAQLMLKLLRKGMRDMRPPEGVSISVDIDAISLL